MTPRSQTSVHVRKHMRTCPRISEARTRLQPSRSTQGPGSFPAVTAVSLTEDCDAAHWVTPSRNTDEPYKLADGHPASPAVATRRQLHGMSDKVDGQGVFHMLESRLTHPFPASTRAPSDNELQWRHAPVAYSQQPWPGISQKVDGEAGRLGPTPRWTHASRARA